MRCQCCNKNLNDFESTRKNADGDYVDLCTKCSKGLGLTLVGRTDLNPDEEPPSEWDDIDDEELLMMDDLDGDEE